MMTNNEVIQFELGDVVTNGDRTYTKLIGGFGEGQPVLTDVQVAEFLDYKNGVSEVRKAVNRNNEYFTDDDIIDLKIVSEVITNNLETLQSLGYTNMQIGKANNIYIFSKAGFLLYLKFAEGDKAVELYKEFIEDYFKTKARVEELEQTIDEQIEYLENQKATLIGRAVMEKNEISRITLMGDIEEINGQLSKLESKRDNQEIDRALQEQSKITESKREYVNQTDFGAMFNLKIGSQMVGKLLKIVGIAQSSRKKTTPYEHCIPKYANSYISQSVGRPCYNWNYDNGVVKIDQFLRDKGLYEQFYSCRNKDQRNQLINHMYATYVD